MNKKKMGSYNHDNGKAFAVIHGMCKMADCSKMSDKERARYMEKKIPKTMHPKDAMKIRSKAMSSDTYYGD